VHVAVASGVVERGAELVAQLEGDRVELVRA
jgi:hypothetical protein